MPRTKKRFGQHFLTNHRLLARIADALDPGPGEAVLEIGPGPGGLTEALTTRGARLTAIEIDRDLVPGLRARFAEARIVEGDALELDWRAVAGVSPRAALVTGHPLQHHVTAPREASSHRAGADRLSGAEEVADRITAIPGTPRYGALGITIQAWHGPIGSSWFRRGVSSSPKVDSAVIRLTPWRIRWCAMKVCCSDAW
jgi:16S rRNA (adenine1518-N6/adenine1519-N6)-dimethyltransferase